MNIKRIHRGGDNLGTITISFSKACKTDPEKENTAQLVLHEKPTEDFQRAFSNLQKHLLAHAELDDLVGDREISVRGVSVKYLDGFDRLGVTIQGTRKLKKSSRPLNINAPYKEEKPDSAEDDGTYMEPKAAKAVKKLLEAAQAYMEGDFMQLTLLQPDDEGEEQPTNLPESAAS